MTYAVAITEAQADVLLWLWDHQDDRNIRYPGGAFIKSVGVLQRQGLVVHHWDRQCYECTTLGPGHGSVGHFWAFTTAGVLSVHLLRELGREAPA